MFADTLTLSVRDCDELRGYVVKHYKIHTRRYNGLSEVFFIAPKRSFQSVEELVDHYKGKVQRVEVQIRLLRVL